MSAARLGLLAAVVLSASTAVATAQSVLEPAIDWESFLGRHDPLWDRMPTRWFDAPFLGNGMLGTLVRQVGEREVRWDVGNSSVHDHREPDDYSVRSPEILNRGRLPIGHFLLRTAGTITGASIRLDLWNAEARGTLETEKGSIEWRTLVHADDMAFLVEWTPTAGEAAARFEFVPEKAESTRFTTNRSRLTEEFVAAYPPNPAPVVEKLEDGGLCEQDLVAGGRTTTAWSEQRDGERRLLWVTCQHSHPGSEATERARAALGRATSADREGWIERHRRWWHDYYPESFLSVSDGVWEGFYWIQMYKLACATRADRALIDNQGPWLQPTGWNGTWWNLNVQLSYSPVATANRLHLGAALTNHLQRNFDVLVDNVEPEFRDDSAGISRNTSMLDLKGRVGRPGGWEFPNLDIGTEVGNLPWTCHNVYVLYRHSMDGEMLRELLHPLLKRAVNYYRHFLFEGEDGRLHLPPTHSPEYRGEPVPDCNYDLALLRWGCRTLIELARRRGVDEELTPVWQEILERLVEPPTDEHGLMVGAGVGFDRSHRHFSHMLAIYPLHVLTPENGYEPLIRKSFERWHSLPGALAGYSYTGGASFAALLGDGDRALDLLNAFRRYFGASTMYFEGGRLPVMETPLHAGQAIHELLLQSWGGRIRVFPACPDAWSEVTFHDLRAEGAFLVSAARAGGVTQWVRVQSLAGEPCVLDTDLAQPAVVLQGRSAALRLRGDGLLALDLAAGEEIVLAREEISAPRAVRPVSSPEEEHHAFGLHGR